MLRTIPSSSEEDEEKDPFLECVTGFIPGILRRFVGGYVCRDGKAKGYATERPHKHIVGRELKRVLWFKRV